MPIESGGLMGQATTGSGAAAASPYSRKNPYRAELIRHEKLTQPGSLKDTRHFVFSLGDSGLSYTPGDSLGIFASNSPALVDEVIRILDFDPESLISTDRKSTRLNSSHSQISYAVFC